MKYRHLSYYKIQKIMRCVCDDLTVSTTVKILSINRNIINAYFNEFSLKILENSITEHSKEFGVFKLDECYLEVCRIRGKEGDEPLAKTKRKGVCNGRTELFKRGSDACNSRQNIEKVRQFIPKSERICTRQKSRKWHRMFLKL